MSSFFSRTCASYCASGSPQVRPPLFRNQCLPESGLGGQTKKYGERARGYGGGASPRAAAANSNNGFSLLELVIVLGILAVVASLATRELSHTQDQHRFTTSQRSLEEIRIAIIGDSQSRAPDGTVLATGFLADVGRYPHSLEELWHNSSGLLPYKLRDVANDPEIRLATGWRGPYLRLPVGAKELRDGWGRTIIANQLADGGLSFGHYGSDGQPDSDASEDSDHYAGDVFVGLPAEQASASLWGKLEFPEDWISPGSAWTIRAYGPNATDGGIRQSEIELTSQTNNVTVWQLDGLTPGTHAVRAYPAGGSTNVTVSALRYITLRHGPNGPVILKIGSGTP